MMSWEVKGEKGALRDVLVKQSEASMVRKLNAHDIHIKKIREWGIEERAKMEKCQSNQCINWNIMRSGK